MCVLDKSMLCILHIIYLHTVHASTGLPMGASQVTLEHLDHLSCLQVIYVYDDVVEAHGYSFKCQ